jgi:hypothetical protein
MRIDYSPLRPPDVLGAVLDPVAASVSRFADAAVARKRQERELALRREQEARLGARDDQRHADAVARQKGIDADNKARIELQERRQIGEAEAKNARARAEVAARIRAAAAGGDEATAEMIDRAYAEADPRTGQVNYGIGDVDPQTGQRRRGFERVPGMAKPEAPKEELPAPTLDPVALSLQGFMGQKRQEKFAQDTEAYEKDQQNPRYRIGGVETSRDDLRHAQSALDAADFDKYIGSTARPGDADGESYAKMLGAQVRGRGLSLQQGTAAWNDYLKTGRKMAFESGENQLDRESRERAAAMRAEAAGKNPFRQASGDRAEEATLDAMTEKVFTKLGFKEIQAGNRKFNDIAAQLTQRNAALDSKTAGTWVKEAQGGTGVISDQDMNQFWGTIGGWAGRSTDAVQRALDGQLGDEKRKIVAEAVQWLAGRAQFNLKQIEDALSRRFDASRFGHRKEGIMRTYFPNWQPEAAPQGDPAAAPAGPTAPPEDLSSEAPLPEDPQAQSIDDMQPTRAQTRRAPAPQLVEGLPPGYVGSARRPAPVAPAKPTREQLIEEIRRRRGAR